METIGQQLKAVRERKGVTASQAAAATHLKVQHVEALERDDYSRLTVPTYAKGFLKIYANYLGLDPAPLLREYAIHYATSAATQPAPGNQPVRATSAVSTFKSPQRILPAPSALPAIPPELLRLLLPGIGAMVVVVLLIMALWHGCHRPTTTPATPIQTIATNSPRLNTTTELSPVPAKPGKATPWVIVTEPPPPYYKRTPVPATTP